MESVWQVLLGWGVLAIVSALLIGAGFNAMSMTPPDFVITRICFSVSATILVFKTATWLARFEAPPRERILASFIVFGIIGATWMWSYTYVGHRESLFLAAQHKDPPASLLPDKSLMYTVSGYPAVELTFIPEHFTDRSVPVLRIPDLSLIIHNRGGFDIDDIRVRITQYTLAYHDIVPWRIEKLPDDKILRVPGKTELVVNTYAKAGADSIVIPALHAHSESQINLATIKDFHFNVDLDGTRGANIDEGFDALRITFVDAATQRRFCFYRVLSKSHPYLLILDDPNLGVHGGQPNPNFPDPTFDPRRVILEHQKKLYAEYPEEEYSPR